MKKKFICLSTWTDKETGQQKSNFGEISEGVNKNGKAYQFTDSERVMRIDGHHAVGTILEYNMTLAPGNPTSKNA